MEENEKVQDKAVNDVEGYRTYNDECHIKDEVTGTEVQELFVMAYDIYRSGTVDDKNKAIKIGTDKEGAHYFAAKHHFLKRVLEIVFKEYEEDEFYEYQAKGLIGFHGDNLVGLIPEMLPAIKVAYSWYLDLIQADQTISSQISKGIESIKDIGIGLVNSFKDLDEDKIQGLRAAFDEAKKGYDEITKEQEKVPESAPEIKETGE